MRGTRRSLSLSFLFSINLLPRVYPKPASPDQLVNIFSYLLVLFLLYIFANLYDFDVYLLFSGYSTLLFLNKLSANDINIIIQIVYLNKTDFFIDFLGIQRVEMGCELDLFCKTRPQQATTHFLTLKRYMIYQSSKPHLIHNNLIDQVGYPSKIKSF